MSDYNTLFDTDLAEYEYMMSKQKKPAKACEECADSTSKCDICRKNCTRKCTEAENQQLEVKS